MIGERLQIFLIALLLSLDSNCFAQGTIIYDNSTPPYGVWIGTAAEFGDEVVPVGSDRTVTQLQIGANMQNQAGAADFLIRLYANDGPTGEPGSLLWQNLFNDVALSGPSEFVPFNVPNISVPNVFTWTVQISDHRPLAVNLLWKGPPTVGSSPPYHWFRSTGPWSQMPHADLMVRVMAVPEPSHLLLISLGFGLLFLRHKLLRS